MSDSNTNDTTTPTVDTSDDLDSFEQEFYGKSEDAPAPKENPVETEDEVDEEVEAEETPSGNDQAATPEDSDDGEEEAPKSQKKRQTAQERIDEITAKYRETERLLQEERAKNQQAPKPQPETPAAPEAEGPKAPTPDDVDAEGNALYPLGEYDPKFIRELTRFTIQQESEAARVANIAREQALQEQARAQALQQNWQESIAEVSEELPDFMEKTQSLAPVFATVEPEYAEFLAQTIMGMDMGPQVLYHLATHPADAQNLVQRSREQAMIALGRIQGMYDRGGDIPARGIRVSKASTPPPINKGNKARKAVRGDTDDLDAFEREFYNRK